jgi:hypothetical protein
VAATRRQAPHVSPSLSSFFTSLLSSHSLLSLPPARSNHSRPTLGTLHRLQAPRRLRAQARWPTGKRDEGGGKEDKLQAQEGGRCRRRQGAMCASSLRSDHRAPPRRQPAGRAQARRRRGSSGAALLPPPPNSNPGAKLDRPSDALDSASLRQEEQAALEPPPPPSSSIRRRFRRSGHIPSRGGGWHARAEEACLCCLLACSRRRARGGDKEHEEKWREAIDTAIRGCRRRRSSGWRSRRISRLTRHRGWPQSHAPPSSAANGKGGRKELHRGASSSSATSQHRRGACWSFAEGQRSRPESSSSAAGCAAERANWSSPTG